MHSPQASTASKALRTLSALISKSADHVGAALPLSNQQLDLFVNVVNSYE